MGLFESRARLIFGAYGSPSALPCPVGTVSLSSSEVIGVPSHFFLSYSPPSLTKDNKINYSIKEYFNETTSECQTLLFVSVLS
jgi:hypothetical protein